MSVTAEQLRKLAADGETPESRWGDCAQCPACRSSDVERQTADEGRPFSCNNCGLEFFADTGEAQA